MKPASVPAPRTAASGSPVPLTVFSPSGVVAEPAALTRALRRLKAMGFGARLDAAARGRMQRFAGPDEARLEALHRVADERPSVALASRGGYGMTRLLDRLDWPRLLASIEAGTRWVGYSDLTALHLGLMARGPAGGQRLAWAGPMACDDFGRAGSDDEAMDDVTRDVFVEALSGELEAIGFRTGPGFDGLERRGRLWGGNLTVLLSLLGTPHFPRAALLRGGILFLEDVNEHPYRVERGLLQLQQAGILDRQAAVLLGGFDGWKASPLDRGYGLRTAVERVRAASATPVLSGLPFGHVRTKVMLPFGQRVDLSVRGRDALIHWG